ncbi:TetR/AcrR family transcriptional regulator [Streptomyces sp. H27-H1]|uniref:TetR/AcrR family transcriptional regulator n=1 Tax=Streptomyces sp. H27-H1 TaxID=2996461 RepID=UPI002270BE30|nr:TetR/AcrR family transcriptional regulator [Streptomyces sp. H27-H1]MCY0932140.1 TetR/AcrR family transcriptional regulator [Streptomyces sp. H27-H1]
MAKDVVLEEARRRRRPTRQGTVLSERLIVETALRMVREHGSAGLSARRLGAALGADPSTLYRYFDGMDGLTLAIGEELIGRAVDGWAPTGRWREDLRSLGLRIHGAYLAHPQAALLTASRVSGRPREVAADEAVLGSLRGAGFADGDAVRIYHAYIDQCLAFAALDAGPLALPAEARESDEERWESTYARLPAEEYPNIAATAGLLAARMPHSAYPVALDMLLDSAERQLAAPAAQSGDQAGRASAGTAIGGVGG